MDGPDALVPATELTIEAAGGLLGLQGDRDRRPIPVAIPQAAFHAGVQAAADVCIALHERLASGRGQHLDVSMQAAVVWTLMNATGYPPNTGGNPPGTSESRSDPPGEIFPGLRTAGILRCVGGFAILNFGLPIVGGRTLHALLRRAEAEGQLEDALCGRDWNLWLRDLRRGDLDVETTNAGIEAAVRFVGTRTKAELMDLAVEQSILLAPVLDVADLRGDPQLAARDYWVEVDGRTHPGPFAKLSETPLRIQSPAPALGEAQALLDSPRAATAAALSAGPTDAGAFAGLKVADFAWVGVGPMISKARADHGATVVHVESEGRPDVLRRLPPMKDGEPGLDRSQFMANFNTSKLGMSLDLGTDEGRQLARRLADWADVVVESFTPGTMKKFGLDYQTLSRARSDLVMLSTCIDAGRGAGSRSTFLRPRRASASWSRSCSTTR